MSHSKIIYIDPNDCGSTLGYRVEDSLDPKKDHSYIDFTMDLSDCQRSIAWNFWVRHEHGEDAMVKMDRIIKLFKEARAALKVSIKKNAEYQKIVTARKAQKDAENKAKDTTTKQEVGIPEDL